MYEVLIDQGADGARKADDITTLQDCLDFCEALLLEECYSFDYDFDEECCWFFDAPENQIRLRRNRNVNHYARKEDCYEGTTILLLKWCWFIFVSFFM